MQTDISFDRKGRCPVCSKPFQDCQHSYSYVQEVLKTVERETGAFRSDVNRLKKQRKRRR